MKRTALPIEAMIRAVQETLGVQVDGRAGPQTWQAIYSHVVKSRTPPAPENISIAPVDSRSESFISTLLPDVQPYARALVQKAALTGITIRIISGTRTWEEQNALYARGRTLPGPKVTNARGGYSNHNFCIAFDVGVFSGQRYLAESTHYKVVGGLGMDLGLEWGGNWKTMVDQPHFQLRPAWANGLTARQMLAELRRRKINNEPVFPQPSGAETVSPKGK